MEGPPGIAVTDALQGVNPNLYHLTRPATHILAGIRAAIQNSAPAGFIPGPGADFRVRYQDLQHLVVVNNSASHQLRPILNRTGNGGWLSREIIVAYLELLAHDVNTWDPPIRNLPQRIVTFTTRFYDHLQSQSANQGPTNMTQRLRPQMLDGNRFINGRTRLVFAPVRLSPAGSPHTRFGLFIIMPIRRNIIYLSSDGNFNDRGIVLWRALLQHELGNQYDDNHWDEFQLAEGVEGDHPWENGVFVCIWATIFAYRLFNFARLRHSRDIEPEEFGFTVDDMADKRMRIAMELIDAQISPLTYRNNEPGRGRLQRRGDLGGATTDEDVGDTDDSESDHDNDPSDDDDDEDHDERANLGGNDTDGDDGDNGDDDDENDSPRGASSGGGQRNMGGRAGPEGSHNRKYPFDDCKTIQDLKDFMSSTPGRNERFRGRSDYYGKGRKVLEDWMRQVWERSGL